MKIALSLFAINILFPLMSSAATLSNLDFESVKGLIPTVGGTPVSEAFPRWTAFLGDTPQVTCLYNNATTGAAAIALFSTFPPGAGFVISGQYTASLQPGVFQGGHVSASLAQTGTIAAGSRAMLFSGNASGMFTVSLAGSLAPIIDLDHSTPPVLPTTDTYGVDVTGWAGKEVELRFTSLANSGGLIYWRNDGR